VDLLDGQKRVNVEAEVQFDFVGAAKRRAPAMAATAMLVFLASYWLAMLLPSDYTSYATILVEPPSVSQLLVETGISGQDLNTRLNLMTAQILSRPRLSRLIDQLGLYQEESEKLTRDAVIALMRSNVSVIPVEGALIPGASKFQIAEINTFQIYFTDDDQKVPSLVAQKLAQNFIDEHIGERIKITQKSLEFVAAEEQRMSGQIRELEARIADLKSANIGSLPENQMSNQRHLLSSMISLQDAQNELARAISDQAYLVKRFAVAPVETGDATLNPEKKVQALELELAEQRSKGFTEKHPDVIDTRLQIDQIRAQIEEQKQQAKEGAAGSLSFAQLTVEAELERAALRVTATREKIARLEREIEKAQMRADKTPLVAEKLDALERQWKQLSLNVSDFENRRVRASVQANLERRQLGEQFRILEPAFRPREPSAPNRLLILGIGVFLAIVMGLGVGVGLEAIDSTLHRARDVQDSLSVPVLASIPAIRFEGDMSRERRRRRWVAAVASGFVLLNLAGGAASFFFSNGLPGWLVPTQPGAKLQASAPETETKPGAPALGSPARPGTAVPGTPIQ
jgi:polysaccharide chain length determinant protein (PEP-CTERM system associated)